ncbi:MAG: hypothetical protein GY805_12615 [Chloroflexi bacterium]|nr:hypothetical protein [Chloroflexota bacterium]
MVAAAFTLAIIIFMVAALVICVIRFLTETYRIPSLLLTFWRSFFVVLTLPLWLGLHRTKPLPLPRRQLPNFIGYRCYS